MATIRQTKSGRFEVQIRKSGLKPITKTFSSRVLARTYIKDTESKIERGLWTDYSLAEATTLSALISMYEREILPEKKARSKDIYNNQQLVKALGQYNLSQLHPHVISGYRQKRLQKVSSGTLCPLNKRMG